MSEYARILKLLDKQIKNEKKLIGEGETDYKIPPSLTAKRLFLKTHKFTLKDWANVRSGDYYARTAYMRHWKRQEYLLQLVNDYLR